MVTLGLRGKLIFILSLVTLLAFVLVYIASSRLVSSLLLERENSYLEHGAQMLVPGLFRLAHDGQELEAAVQEVGRLGQFDAIQLLSPQLETLIPRHGMPAEVMVGRKRLEQLQQRKGEALLLRPPSRQPMFATLQELPGGGYLFASRSAADYEDRRAGLTSVLMLWSAVVMLALLLMGVILLRSVVVRPIERLVRQAGDVAVGGSSAPLTVAAGDEFGFLRDSLEAMAGRVQQDRQRIARQVDELQRMNQELVEAQDRLIRTEKLASVGQLAAGVAHEIGNPIGIITGYLDMLEDGTLVGEQAARALAQVRTATERIDRTIKDLLNFSRPALDEQAHCDVVRHSREVIKLLAPQKRFRQVELKLESTLPDGHSNCRMPPSRFKQVLVNLLLNAADAMDGKGEVRMELASDAQGIRLEVRDSGPGIDEELLHRIFDPFFTTKDVGKGTGLGLFVCHTLVSRYGGEIQVSSQPGKGAAFTLVLPLAGDASEEAV